jgi:hypothetical protein
MLLENDSASLQFKAKLTVANVPAIMRFALGCKHAGIPVYQQFVNGDVKCTPEPLSLNGADHVSSNYRECKDGDVRGCEIPYSSKHMRSQRIQLTGFACKYVWFEQWKLMPATFRVRGNAVKAIYFAEQCRSEVRRRGKR